MFTALMTQSSIKQDMTLFATKKFFDIFLYSRPLDESVSVLLIIKIKFLNETCCGYSKERSCYHRYYVCLLLNLAMQNNHPLSCCIDFYSIYSLLFPD